MEKLQQKQSWMGFVIGLLLWFGVYAVIGWFMFGRLKEDFSVFEGNNIVMQSVRQYRLSLWVMLGLVAILSVVWWWLAYCEWRVRQSYEEKTLFFALGFIVVLGLGLLWISYKNPSIMDEMGNLYQYPFWRWILCGFAGNLFAIPPRNVERVMFFGGLIGSRVCGFLLYGVAAFEMARF